MYLFSLKSPEFKKILVRKTHEKQEGVFENPLQPFRVSFTKENLPLVHSAIEHFWCRAVAMTVCLKFLHLLTGSVELCQNVTCLTNARVLGSHFFSEMHYGL